jgi:hypothetical protein
MEGIFSTYLIMDKIILDILTTRSEILEALLRSKISNTIIGIKSESLGPGIYMTSVVELVINESNEATVVLKGYDMTGYFLDKSVLRLEEIEGVIPFRLLFENPFLRDIKREMRDNNSFKLKVV